MIGLLKKDILIIKNQKITIIIFILIALINGYSNSILFMFSLMSLLSISLVLMTITYYKENNGLTYILALPINKMDYIKEKYLLVLDTLCSSLLISFLATFLLTYIKPNTNNTTVVILFATLLASIFCLTYGSIMIPLYLKYGVEKARLCSFIAIVFLIIMFITLINLSNFALFANSFLINLPIELTTIVALGVCLLLFFCSYFVSKKINIVQVKNIQI